MTNVVNISVEKTGYVMLKQSTHKLHVGAKIMKEWTTSSANATGVDAIIATINIA